MTIVRLFRRHRNSGDDGPVLPKVSVTGAQRVAHLLIGPAVDHGAPVGGLGDGLPPEFDQLAIGNKAPVRFLAAFRVMIAAKLHQPRLCGGPLALAVGLLVFALLIEPVGIDEASSDIVLVLGQGIQKRVAQAHRSFSLTAAAAAVNAGCDQTCRRPVIVPGYRKSQKRCPGSTSWARNGSTTPMLLSLGPTSSRLPFSISPTCWPGESRRAAVTGAMAM